MCLFTIISKGTVHHTAYNACQKCEITGEYFTHTHRMSFPMTNCSSRTDADFRSRSSIEHHREYSIIEELPIDMVKDFITSDSLHLLHLGIMKKFVKIWRDGGSKLDYKWNDSDMSKMNTFLERCNRQKPNDIHRAIRNLHCYKFWKGTEFRTFLMYVGVVILKETLAIEEYNHFLKLFCAVRLCSHDKYLKYERLAKELFDEFVDNYIEIYGKDTISSNVHNISHIIEDVRNFGNLTKIDAYPFENFLNSLKLKVKKCNKPLEQISRRTRELDNLKNNFVCPIYFDLNDNFIPVMKYPFINNVSNETVYKQISICKNSFLSSRKFGDK